MQSQYYNQPHRPMRMFVYLVGRKPSKGEIWIACDNRGNKLTVIYNIKSNFIGYRPH